MTQDLFDWLNSTHTEEGTRGLLLAPVGSVQSEDPQEEQTQEQEQEQAKITALNDAWQGVSEEQGHADALDERLASQEYVHSPDEWQVSQKLTPTPDEQQDLQEYVPSAETWQDPQEYIPSTEEQQTSQEQAASTEEPLLSPDDVLSPAEAPSTDSWQGSSDDWPPSSDSHASILNQAWHDAASLTINLNEPPQEMWADIPDDDEPKDYIETSSLQGDAYIPLPKHGTNFTQRLQATLKGRKERAERLREQEAENEPHHPYALKAAIFCASLVIALGFAFFVLWFTQRETPEGLNSRARALFEQGQYDEAAALYQRGYIRYPHILTFLTGIARSAEKAGHPQTAITAWNEYLASLPKDDNEHRSSAQSELDRLIPGGDTHTETQQTPPPPPPPEPQHTPRLPEVRPMTFDEALQEGNHAFNIGMYSRAIANFHKAHAIRENDIRPYIGLAGAYRAKGMFFDAKRLLDEARRKFGRNPTLEMEREYLKEE